MKEMFDKKELVSRYKEFKMKQSECSSETLNVFTEKCAEDSSSISSSRLTIYGSPFTRQERRWLARKGYKI